MLKIEESTSAISADVPSTINVEGGRDKNVTKDDTNNSDLNSVLNSISASPEIPSAIDDGTPTTKTTMTRMLHLKVTMILHLKMIVTMLLERFRFYDDY